MLRKSSPLWGVTLLPLLLSGCGSQEAPASEAAGVTPSADSTVRASAPLTEEELELRRERIRAYLRARLARLNIVATTRTDSGQVIDWVPAPRDVPERPPSPEATGTRRAAPSSAARPSSTSGPPGPANNETSIAQVAVMHEEPVLLWRTGPGPDPGLLLNNAPLLPERI